MKLENIIVWLRIEKDNRKYEKKSLASHLVESNTNIMEGGIKINKKRKHNGDRQTSSSFRGMCYNCGGRTSV